MKVISTKTLKDGRKRVLIELGSTELNPVAPLLGDAFYRLGYPMDNAIVGGYILQDPQRVAWDSYSQKWEDA
jgi:hypothetical protein